MEKSLKLILTVLATLHPIWVCFRYCKTAGHFQSLVWKFSDPSIFFGVKSLETKRYLKYNTGSEPMLNTFYCTWICFPVVTDRYLHHTVPHHERHALHVHHALLSPHLGHLHLSLLHHVQHFHPCKQNNFKHSLAQQSCSYQGQLQIWIWRHRAKQVLLGYILQTFWNYSELEFC